MLTGLTCHFLGSKIPSPNVTRLEDPLVILDRPKWPKSPVLETKCLRCTVLGPRCGSTFPHLAAARKSAKLGGRQYDPRPTAAFVEKHILRAAARSKAI